MKVAALGLAAAAVVAAADSSDCQSSYDGSLTLTIWSPATKSSKRDVRARAANADGSATEVIVTLKDGILTDAHGRTGSIVANNQFQFDDIVQSDAISAKDFSVCKTDYGLLLAQEGNQDFFKCNSGTFANLYNKDAAAACQPIWIQATPAGGKGGSAASVIPDGQVQAGTSAGAKASQIPDGQVQAGTAKAPAGAPITQIGDGQLQVATAAAPTGAKATQIADGQVQAPTASAPKAGAQASQIGDGQVQAPTAAAPKAGAQASQIGDGQVQAPTAAAPKAGAQASQIGDGQVQAPTAAAPKATPAQVTNAAEKSLPRSVAALILGAVAAVFAL